MREGREEIQKMVCYYGYVKWYRQHLSDVKLSKRLRVMGRANRKIGCVCYKKKRGVSVYYNSCSKSVCFVVDLEIIHTIPYEHEVENNALLDSIQMEENRRSDRVSEMMDSLFI